jgi:hypothetical protein
MSLTPSNESGPSKKVGPDFFKKTPTKKIANKHEKDVAKRSGGRRVPGSGNILGMPGDVADERFRRECKATHGGGTSIQAKWVKKISAEALAINKIPLIELRLEGQQEPTPKDWVMLPAHEFQNIMDKLKKLEG